MGPPFPIKSNTKSHKSIIKSTLKRRTEGGRRRGGGLENRGVHEQITKAAINLTQVKGYLYPRDRSDRYAGPVRPVPGIGQTGWPAAPPVQRSHPTAEVLSSKRSLLRDAAVLMKIQTAASRRRLRFEIGRAHV